MIWLGGLSAMCHGVCLSMRAVGNDRLNDALFSKDRLAFIDHFVSAIWKSSVLDNIIVHLPSILGDEELQI